MSVKIKLGEAPKTFKPIPVTFTLPDGQQGVVTVVYKYRTRSGYAEFMDSMREAAAASFDGADGSMATVHGLAMDADASTLLGAVDSWDLDVSLARDELKLLADQAPAVIHAVVASYRRACVEGHLGN